jgi:hypothetical protein
MAKVYRFFKNIAGTLSEKASAVTSMSRIPPRMKREAAAKRRSQFKEGRLLPV